MRYVSLRGRGVGGKCSNPNPDSNPFTASNHHERPGLSQTEEPAHPSAYLEPLILRKFERAPKARNRECDLNSRGGRGACREREVSGFGISKYFGAHLSPCSAAEVQAFKAKLATGDGE